MGMTTMTDFRIKISTIQIEKKPNDGDHIILKLGLFRAFKNMVRIIVAGFIVIPYAFQKRAGLHYILLCWIFGICVGCILALCV